MKESHVAQLVMWQWKMKKEEKEKEVITMTEMKCTQHSSKWDRIQKEIKRLQIEENPLFAHKWVCTLINIDCIHLLEICFEHTITWWMILLCWEPSWYLESVQEFLLSSYLFHFVWTTILMGTSSKLQQLLMITSWYSLHCHPHHQCMLIHLSFNHYEVYSELISQCVSSYSSALNNTSTYPLLCAKR